MNVSIIYSKDIIRDGIVNDCLVTVFKQSLGGIGVLVNKPVHQNEKYDGIESDTVTRHGMMFWDSGEMV
jgi:hypothetical protein